MNDTAEAMDCYFRGEKLFGDDFSAAQIEEWYRDEQEGYADLGAKDAASYSYQYHALNDFHGFSRWRGRSFEKVLGFGSAYGDELAPALTGAKQVTVVDPSSAFVRDRIHGVPADYVKPQPSGRLPLPDASYDFACCLGVLHHIPNVSFVLSEIARVLKPGGKFLLREPIVSMGDWRRPRAGLTKRERGIPLKLLEQSALRAGFEIEEVRLCDFALTPRLFPWAKDGVYNNAAIVRFDAMLARLFAWNMSYHAESTLARLRPASAYLLLQKPGDAARTESSTN